MRKGRYLARVALGLLLLANSLAVHAKSVAERNQVADMKGEVTAAALARKARSEALLLAQGVPINQYLPAIEDETQVPKRGRDEIANRALALFVVAMKGEGVDEKLVSKVIADHGLERHFSPDEQ